MAAISAFPNILTVGDKAYNQVETFTCYAAVLRGQVVQVHSGAVTIEPCPTSSPTMPLGVAIDDGAAGQEIGVIISGEAYVANGDASTAIIASAEVSTGTYAGAVIVAVTTATGYAVGRTIEAIAGGGTGRIFVCPHVITKAGA